LVRAAASLENRDAFDQEQICRIALHRACAFLRRSVHVVSARPAFLDVIAQLVITRRRQADWFRKLCPGVSGPNILERSVFYLQIHTLSYADIDDPWLFDRAVDLWHVTTGQADARRSFYPSCHRYRQFESPMGLAVPTTTRPLH